MADTNTNMTVATPRDYWISPNALHIERNAMSNPDYIQASCVSGAQILVYIKDVISYDAGHNYRRWSLQASPTVFNTHTEKYVYVAIPRDSVTSTAMVVFPSELLDIYGKNEKQEQIGSENYYYIFLQGILTSSGDNGTTPRDWKKGYEIVTGYLSSDEALASSNLQSEWYEYSNVSQIVTLLKDLTMKPGTKFRQLYAQAINILQGGALQFENQGSISGIADNSTPSTATDQIATPKYVDDRTISKLHNDTAQAVVTFLQKQIFRNGMSLGNGDDFSIDGAGRAVLSEVAVSLLKSLNYNNAEQTGFAIEQKNGKYQMSITDLIVWGKAIFNTLQLRELSYVGGNIVLSPSASKLTHVVEIRNNDGEITGWKCYLLADDGSTATINSWKVDDQARCQTFNIKTGVYENVGNKDYWRRVTEVSQDNEVITDGNGHELYDGKKFAWIILSKTDCSEGADAVVNKNNSPAAGDSLVLIGNRTDKSRQNMLLLETEGSEAPRFVMYRGINNYSLANRSIVSVSYNGINIRIGYIHYTSPSGDTIWAPCYRGDWKEGTEYSYYDEVTWLGTRWLCIVPEGDTTITEPSEDNDYWRATTAIFSIKLALYHDLAAGICKGETHTVECRLMLGDKDVTSAVKSWAASRKTDDAADDIAWALKDKVKNFKGSIDITWANDNSEDDLGRGDVASFTFTAITNTGDVHKATLEL
ncbi:MAG: hypothetical protein SOY11_03250 [Prevotella sp.]|nr:hypothetical protein [Prevotella sp.]